MRKLDDGRVAWGQLLSSIKVFVSSFWLYIRWSGTSVEESSSSDGLLMADGWRAHTQLFLMRPGELGWDCAGGRKSIFRIWMSFAKNGLASSLSVSCH